MDFKIEINYLDVTNYPSIKKHFEDMASRGWLIRRIIAEKVFIYKRINPKELDFLIRPYEVVNEDNNKTKEELEKFRSKYKTMGWNYITKLRNLHICFKGKNSEVINLEDDDKEKFKTIEKIAKKQLIRSYISISILILLIWFILSEFIAPVDFIKNGLLQVVIVLIPLFLVSSISSLLRTQRFLEVNRKNIKIGKKIEYSKSKFNLEKIMFFSRWILIVTLVISTIYVGVTLKNSLYLFVIGYALMLLILNPIINIIDNILLKPSKESRILQLLIFIITFSFLFFIINFVYLSSLDKFIKEYNDLDVEEFRILSPDRPGTKDEEEAKIYQNSSLMVPKSYKYGYFNFDKRVYIATEYSNALNEDIARTVVNMHKRYAKDQLKQYKFNLEMAIEDDNYYIVEEVFNDTPEDFPREKTLEELGLTLEEFERIDKNIITKAVKEATKIIEDKAIIVDKENLWNLEEVYFLSYEKDQVLIREGKEVFYLEGKDFSDPEIIKNSKDKLNL